MISPKLLPWLGVGIVSACCACGRLADGPRPGLSAASGHDAAQPDDGGGCGPAPSPALPPSDDSAARRLSAPAAQLPDEPDTVSSQHDDDFAALVRALEQSTAEAAEDGEQPTESAAGRPVRWAILGSRALRDARLTDLVTARLSSLGGLELVEREELRSIAAEYALAELGSAGAVGRRLRLGTLLRADRLLLVSRLPRAEVADGADDAVRLVIADCLSGARIGHEAWPADTGSEELIAAIVAAVEQTQRRFPEGVARIVGVSHFLSRNLVHDFDHRQAGYAYLLQHALALHPGTAVLEIEEARAVALELSLGTPDGTEDLRGRLVPALVDGEFTVSVDPGSGVQTVDLVVSMHRGKHADEIRKSALPPADVVALLIEELPRQILELDPEETRFSVDEQRDWLVARAREFGLVGAWQHSLGLREAALLIDPGNVRLRLDTITEDSLLMCRPLPVPVSPARVPTEDEIRAEYRARVDAYIARMAHVEFLIRNRLVRAEELLAGTSSGGAPRFPPLLESGSFNWLSSSRCAPVEARRAESSYQRIAREEYAALEPVEAAFMDTVFPLIPSLKRNDSDYTSIRQWVAYLLDYHQPKPPARAHGPEELDRIYRKIVTALDADEGLGRTVQTQWAAYLLEQHERRLGSNPPSAEDLNELFHIIADVFPVDADLHRGLMERLKRIGERDLRQQVEQAEREPIDWRQTHQKAPFVGFLNRLVENDRPIVQLYGRLGLLHRRWLVWDECWRRRPADRTAGEAARSELLAELNSLKEEVDQLVAVSATVSTGHDRSDALPIQVLARSIQMRLASASPPKSNIIRVGSFKHYKPGEEDRLPRFEFAGQVNMVVRALTAQHTNGYPIVGWRQCTDNLDVLWNERAVLVMKEAGIAQEILSDTAPRFLDARWDGRQLWIVTQHGGLFVLSPAGELVHRIGAGQGLPPYDRGAVLHPIQPGVVFIAGSFGDQQRGWCAVVDLRKDPPVRVIYEATTVPSHITRLGGSDPVSWVFTPSYAVEVAGASPEQRLLLVVRKQGEPLAVDLQTLKVSRASVLLYDYGSPAWEKDFLCYSGQGRLLQPTGMVNGKTIQELSGGSVLIPHSLSSRQLCEEGGGSQRLLPLGQWVYVPDGRGYWYRIHRETFEEQPVLKKPSASEFEIRPHTVFRISAHYGILAGSCSDALHYGPYHQVRIHEPP